MLQSYILCNDDDLQLFLLDTLASLVSSIFCDKTVDRRLSFELNHLKGLQAWY